MPSLNLIMDGDGCWPDLAPIKEKIESGQLIHLTETKWEMALLRRGMASGEPSVSLRIDLPDGRVLLAETSWALLNSAALAFAARLEEEKAGRL